MFVVLFGERSTSAGYSTPSLLCGVHLFGGDKVFCRCLHLGWIPGWPLLCSNAPPVIGPLLDCCCWGLLWCCGELRAQPSIEPDLLKSFFRGRGLVVLVRLSPGCLLKRCISRGTRTHDLSILYSRANSARALYVRDYRGRTTPWDHCHGHTQKLWRSICEFSFQFKGFLRNISLKNDFVLVYCSHIISKTP